MIHVMRMTMVTAACVLLLMLAGCGSSYTMRGKVVPGTVGVVTVVPSTDERLEATVAGVEGVKVELRRAQTVVASSTTLADGSFTMKLNPQTTASRFDVVASGPSIFPVRSNSYPAREGQTMLIVADTRRVSTEE